MSLGNKVLLFDLGGVIFDIDFGMMFDVWESLGPLDRKEIMQRFAMDETYIMHETGQIGWLEYEQHLRSILQLEATSEQISAGWNAIFLPELDGVVSAVSRIRSQTHCAILSNSNPTHKQYWEERYQHVLSNFDEIYVSSDIGYRKPDFECFEYVAKAMGVAREEVVFFDDTLENVTQAREAGLDATHVRSEEDVLIKLEELGYT